MIALPPVGVHAAAEEIFGLAATEDDISRSSFAPANAAARSCPLTRSRWSDCVHWSDERSSRTPRKWGCATAKSAHEKSHVCSSATAETASPRYALLYPELSTLPQRPSEKSGMSVCKNLQEVSRYRRRSRHRRLTGSPGGCHCVRRRSNFEILSNKNSLLDVVTTAVPSADAASDGSRLH